MAGKKKPVKDEQVAPTEESESDLSHLDGPQEDTPEASPKAGTTEAPEDTTPESSKVPPPELPKPKHPAGLRRRALAFGATAEQIDATSLDDLDAWVEEQEEARPKPKPEAPKKDDDEIDWGTDELGNALTEKDVSPGIAKNIRALHKKTKDLEATVKTSQEREKSRQQRAVNEAADVAIETMGEKYEKVFGKGEMRDLDPNSKAAKRRIAAFKAAGIDELDSQAAIIRKLKSAANELFEDLIQEAPKKAGPKDDDEEEEEGGDEIDKAPTNGKHFTKEEWAAGTTAKPTSHRPKPLKGDELLHARVKEWQRANNMTDETKEEQFAGLPD